MARGKKMGIGKKILLLLLAVFIIMQFSRIDKTNPKVDKAKDFITLVNPPADIEKTIRAACYDCHSNETEYPWYTNVAPVSWIIGNHIEEGREYFNFSTWADYDEDKKNHLLHECEEELEKEEMPLSSYTWTHGDANLSDEKREELAEWFEDQMTGPDKGHSHEEHEH
ncbi:MAG: heme-binding domain-containing protein [Crocinitomicaceae bacterium]